MLQKIILSIFSEETCNSLYERAIAVAFQKAISKLPSSTGLKAALYGSKIYRIKQKFLASKDN